MIFSQHIGAASNSCHACVELALFLDTDQLIRVLELQIWVIFLFFYKFDLQVTLYFILISVTVEHLQENGKFVAKTKLFATEIEALVEPRQGNCCVSRQ